MAANLLLIELALSSSNDDILDQMRIMKRAHEDNVCGYVACAIRGFENDDRELFDIPEVRAFCRRIVNLGFISYLEPSPKLDDGFPIGFSAWGAVEVWLCGEGRLSHECELSVELLDEIEEALVVANETADAALGPIECQIIS